MTTQIIIFQIHAIPLESITANIRSRKKSRNIVTEHICVIHIIDIIISVVMSLNNRIGAKTLKIERIIIEEIMKIVCTRETLIKLIMSKQIDICNIRDMRKNKVNAIPKAIKGA